MGRIKIATATKRLLAHLFDPETVPGHDLLCVDRSLIVHLRIHTLDPFRLLLVIEFAECFGEAAAINARQWPLTSDMWCSYDKGEQLQISI